MPIVTNGPLYRAFAAGKNIQQATLTCATAVVESLVAMAPDASPGMLLGKIQSGKTRTFITALALAFDNGFDWAIVFTKGVKVLTQQTVVRIGDEFENAAQRDMIRVFEMMSMAENLPPAILGQKLVVVCKKEDDNIERLRRFIDEVYPSLKDRKCLIIDDEADFASVGYRRNGAMVVSAVIPGQIDALRQLFEHAAVLQVTATPYSLYLQPSVVPAETGLSMPIRPTFTHLVPVGPGYVGGDVYFERSRTVGSVEEMFHVDITSAELDVLRRQDRAVFLIEQVLQHPAVPGIRRAVITFLLGGFVRRWQKARQNPRNEPLPKYAFIVHSETATASHAWQVAVVERIRDDLRAQGAAGATLRQLVDASLSDLRESLTRAGLPVPNLDECQAGVYQALDSCMVQKVNNESQVAALLDRKGELRLDAHYNVFVGGNILDRGVTVPNVIGFFYGRRPNVSQQDTVLQHCRMYGYRPREDLAVTRFYTTAGIYASMIMIHEFDTALRSDLEAGRQPQGVYFLRADAQRRVRACGPQRLLASRLETVTADSQKLLLPLGFDVRADQAGRNATTFVDQALAPAFGPPTDVGPRNGSIDADSAAEILEHIKKSLDLGGTDGWDAKGHAVLLKYLAKATQPQAAAPQVRLHVIRGFSRARIRQDGRVQNYFMNPDQLRAARAQTGAVPGLLLVRQVPGAGFRPVPFWWPMLLMPSGIRPYVFALN